MSKASLMTLLIVGMLITSAAFADEATTFKIVSAKQPIVTFSAVELRNESLYTSQWRRLQSVSTSAHSDDWFQPLYDVDFHDTSTLARASKLRGLSFLTLADFGQSRVYLGVNDDGLVGLHFRVFSRHGDESYLEMARMPYLKDTDPDK